MAGRPGVLQPEGTQAECTPASGYPGGRNARGQSALLGALLGWTRKGVPPSRRPLGQPLLSTPRLSMVRHAVGVSPFPIFIARGKGKAM
jgi:hypothetical protein